MNTYNNMATPNLTPEFDINKIIEALIAMAGILWATLSYMGKYYKDKASERESNASAKKIETEDFIQKVAVACVRATLDSALKDVKDDINILFKYRDEDRKHYDDRFDKVITAIKK